MIILLCGAPVEQLTSGTGGYDYQVKGSVIVGATVVSGLALTVAEIDTANKISDSDIMQINLKGMSDCIVLIENDLMSESKYINLYLLKNVPIEFKRSDETSITIYHTSF